MQTRGIRILVAGKYIRVLVTMHGITPVVNDLQEVIGYPSAYPHHSGLYTTAHGMLIACPIHNLYDGYRHSLTAITFLNLLQNAVERDKEYRALVAELPPPLPVVPVMPPPAKSLDEPIHTGEFNGITVCAYGMPDNPLWTRTQIGEMLEYADPLRSIAKIHNRNRKRLDQFSTVVKMTTVDGKQRDIACYTFIGFFEVCRFSKRPNADAVIDYAWHVMDEIRKNGAYTVAPQFNVPQTFGEALQLAADQQKQLESKEQELRLAKEQADAQDLKIIEQAQHIAENAGRANQSRLAKASRRIS